MTPPRLLSVARGHVLVHYTHQRDAGPGSHAYGVGLFAAPEDEYHAYVVWTVIDRVEWFVEAGDYCQTFGEALDAYQKRGGEFR